MNDGNASSRKPQDDTTVPLPASTPRAAAAAGSEDPSKPARGATLLTRVFTAGEKAELQRLHLHDAEFDHVDFVSADLRGVRFERVSLRGADFTDADLRGARFVECDLRGARLRGIRLGGTRFVGSRLAGATGMTLTQMLYLCTRGVRSAVRAPGR